MLVSHAARAMRLPRAMVRWRPPCGDFTGREMPRRWLSA